MSFGHLGSLGQGFGRLGGSIAPGVVPEPSDIIPGTLTISGTSPTTDTTPALTIDFPYGNGDASDVAAGYVLVIDASDDDFATSTNYVTYTLTSDDITAIVNETPFTISGATPLSVGTWKFRGHLENGALIGDDSADWEQVIEAVGGSTSTAAATLVVQAGSINYRDFQQDNTSGGTLTNSILTGTAGTNRRVLIGWVMGNSYDAPVASLSDSLGSTWTIISKQTGTNGEFGSFSGQMGWAWADIATGTTVDLTFHGGTSSGNGGLRVFVFTVDKSTLLGAATTNYVDLASGTSAAPSVTAGDGGFAISMLLAPALTGAATSVGLTSSTQAMTNIVDEVTINAGSVSADYKSSGVTAGTWTATYGWTNNSHALASLLHWR